LDLVCVFVNSVFEYYFLLSILDKLQYYKKARLPYPTSILAAQRALTPPRSDQWLPLPPSR